MLFLLLVYFDPKTVIFEIKKLSPFCTTVICILIVSFTILGAYNSYLIINLEKRLKFSDYIPIYWASWAFALILPGQVGDITTLSIIMKKHGLDISKTLGRSLIDKLISFIITGVFAIIGITSLPNLNIVSYWQFFILITLFLFIYSQRKSILFHLPQVQPKLIKFLNQVKNEARKVVQKHPLKLGGNIILTLCKTILTGIIYWYVFQSLGYKETTILQITPLVAACSLIAYLPISINGIGTTEIAGIFFFSTVGISETSVLSTFIVLRFLIFIIGWTPVILYFLFRKTLKGPI